MNLQELIERYICYRRSLGEKFKTPAIVLRAFGRAIGAHVAVADVRPEQVSAFLAGHGPLTNNWHFRHNALRGFYRYAVSRGYVTTAPLPTVIPQRPPPFVPYIYTHDELRRLLRATGSYQRKRTPMEPLTMYTIVLLLYGTGLRVSEAIALNRADVNLERSLLTVRQTKFRKSRLVPFGPQIRNVLDRYICRRPTLHWTVKTLPFFTTRTGSRVRQETVEKCFVRMREEAGVRRSDGASRQPRLHDLRHTFAVHRVTSWYRQGADVQTLLPQLSVYLGHVHLVSTQVYLSMTPDLLAEANARFARYAGKEDSHD